MACRVGKALKRLREEMPPPNVVKLRENVALRAQRDALMGAAVAYCEVRCGGCPLTRGEP